MFDNYEKALLRELVQDHLKEVKSGNISYGCTEDNLEVVETLKKILKKLN